MRRIERKQVKRQRIRAMTMIELLTVVGICSFLLMLILPAVQRTRETARKISCHNQLRQLALAAMNYESTYGAFPSGDFFRQVRSFLESSQNSESLQILACPSDSEADGNLSASRISYAVNDGLGAAGTEFRGIVPLRGKVTRSSEIRDGLSNTALVSERLSFPWYAPQVVAWDERPQDWKRTFLYFKGDATNPDQFRSLCGSGGNRPVSTWYFTHQYHHLMPPNSYSCLRVTAGGIASGDFAVGASAASVHIGGALSAFCDGSVSFINDQISRAVWQAQGTSCGNEYF